MVNSNMTANVCHLQSSKDLLDFQTVFFRLVVIGFLVVSMY